jgi:hypothetical protein
MPKNLVNAVLNSKQGREFYQLRPTFPENHCSTSCRPLWKLLVYSSSITSIFGDFRLSWRFGEFLIFENGSQNKSCTVASVAAPVARAGPGCATHVAPSRYSSVRTHCRRRYELMDEPWTLRPTPGHTARPPCGSRAGATRQALQLPASRRSRGLPSADGLKGDEMSTPMFLSLSASLYSTDSFCSA